MAQINLKKMKTLTDLMQEERHAYYHPVAHQYNHDHICREYNNLWGMLSDTHMSKHGEDYIVTGSMTGTDKFIPFITMGRIENMPVQYASGLGRKVPFYEYMWQCGYKGDHAMFNGDSAFRFTKREEFSPIPQGASMTYTTSDSLMPRPIAQLGEHAVEKIQHYESIEQMNEDYTIRGNAWMVCGNCLISNENGLQHKIEIK